MKFVLFCHSLLSDWNHGNAHFLRGVITELLARGHRVHTLEPKDAWSVANLVQERGELPVEELRQVYPTLSSERYDPATLELDRVLDDADVVLVHEWNDPELVERIGQQRARGGRFKLLFHDTHHRSVTDPDAMRRYRLDAYDAVLAFGETVRQVYLRAGWAQRVFTWHEAADVRVFKPLPSDERSGDLVWIGNWGDEERTQELREFLLEPVQKLRLRATVHGVRYPADAREELRQAGIEYRGWLPNYQVPQTFARYAVTVHVPRRPYTVALPGIPTIRVFEALACGIPLISAPWSDAEGLFQPGDYLVAQNGAAMQSALSNVLSDRGLQRELRERGLSTILARHTCAHRVDELLEILERLEFEPRSASRVARNGAAEALQ